jgi:hypothetical protein
MNLPFLIECSQSQSLNTCKRVGVSGHIPELLGTWGLSTISLGKSVSQERKAKRGNLYGLGQQFLESQVFVHGKKGEREERELGAGATMEGEF